MMIEKYITSKKYTNNCAVNETMHWLERFVKMEKLSETDKVLLMELISSLYEQAFIEWYNSVE
jgi:hypothetical protein